MKKNVSVIPTNLLSHRSHFCSVDRCNLFWFDWFFIGTILLGIGTSLLWKTQGSAVLIGIALLSCIYAIHGHFSYGIFLRNKILLAWTILGILHLGLSLMAWLPGTPVFFRQEYVLRMGYFTFLVYPATAAFYLLFTRTRQAGKLRLLAWLNIYCMTGAALVYHFFPAYDGHWRVEGQNFGLISDVMSVLNYGIHNISILFWWGMLLLTIEYKWMVILVLGGMSLSDSAQMKLLAILTAALLLWPRPKNIIFPISIAIILGFPFAAFLLVLFANDLGIDYNTIGRANWWVETLKAVMDNFGFAYGFGSDNITDYHVAKRFLMHGKSSRLPIQVVHNEFVYMFHAMGLAGGVLFILFYLKELCPRIANDLKLVRHAGLMFLMVCLTTSVNVALVSPAYILGLCWIYGYLLEINNHPVVVPTY